jgi:threonine dehydratase
LSRIPTHNDIRNAYEKVKFYINKTPVLTSSTFNEACSGSVFFKCENFQKVGAFKFRGACNTVLSLDKNELSGGVVTHSSGNHAAALSLAAKLSGIPAYIIMPSNALSVKVNAVKYYGGTITFCEPTLAARESTAERIMKETGSTLVHPYDDYRIIAGAATAAYEFLEEVPDLDYLLAPVGGGGLISGTALSAHYSERDVTVIACEPEKANDAYLSFKEGRIVEVPTTDTIADGLRTLLSDKTFGIISEYVSEIVTVTENEIINAMRFVWERMKIIIEPSSAVPAAALLSGKIKTDGKKTGVIISGGNVDLQNLPFSSKQD